MQGRGLGGRRRRRAEMSIRPHEGFFSPPFFFFFFCLADPVQGRPQARQLPLLPCQRCCSRSYEPAL